MGEYMSKHLCSPEKLYGRSQNIYVLPRNFAFTCKILSTPKKCCLLAKLLSSSNKLYIHVKTFLRSPEKLAIYLKTNLHNPKETLNLLEKNICIPPRNCAFVHSQNFCITPRNFAFPQETVLS